MSGKRPMALVIGTLLTAAALTALSGCSGKPNAAGAAQPPAVPDGTPAAQGREVFRTTCSACHGIDARGMGPGMGPDLVQQSDWLKSQSADSIKAFVTGGGQHPKVDLTDDQIKLAAQYVQAIRKN